MADRRQLTSEPGEAALDFSDLARQCCLLARREEDAGDYETARRIMSPFWQRAGEWPELEGLSEVARAEVLLRAGSLTGWIGSARRVEGAQEVAKDLVSESISIFERLRLHDRLAEALTSLATCYWRSGAFDEARSVLRAAFEQADDRHDELKAWALILSAVVENSAARPGESLRLLNEAAPLFERLENDSLKGRFHATLANSLQRLGTAENRTDYTDRALVEYAAASFHYERAGHERYLATIENNIGFLFYTLGRYDDAHEHLTRSRALLARLGDHLRAAQVDETRARVLLGQGRNAEAERAVKEAVATFEQSEEPALLAEALTTRATALARLNFVEEARATYRNAIGIAERAGSIENAGLAALALLEELGEKLPDEERRFAIPYARTLLARSQQPEVLARVRRVLASEGDASPAEQPAPERGSAAPTEAVEDFILSARARHRKQVAFTDEAIAAMHRLFLSDGLRRLGEIIDQTVASADDATTINAEAVQLVALRRTSQANFADPWAGFTLKEEIRLIEKQFIELALREADGRVSLAAKLLGFNHPELLNSMIKSRHPELLARRTPRISRSRRGGSKGRPAEEKEENLKKSKD
jgi:tetratricopeptide (TPR) repeat protein